MIERLRSLYEEIKTSRLARVSLVTTLVVPILAWSIGARLQIDLLPRWLLEMIPLYYSIAVEILSPPYIPFDVWHKLAVSLEPSQSTALLPSVLLIASTIALVLAVIRHKCGRGFVSSLAVGYLAAIAILETLGAVPWVVLAVLLQGFGDH